MMIQMRFRGAGNSMPMRRREVCRIAASVIGRCRSWMLFEAHSDGGQSGDSAPLHHETAGCGSMMRCFLHTSTEDRIV